MAGADPWLTLEDEFGALGTSPERTEDAFARWLAEPGHTVPLPASPVVFSSGLSAAVVSRNGDVVAATPGFAADCRDDIIDPEAIERALFSPQPVVGKLAVANAARTVPGIVAYAGQVAARVWQLPNALREALAPGDRVAMIVSLPPSAAPLARATAAFGLTGLEARVCAAIITTGDIRSAASRCAISYATAREAAAGAMARMGVRKLPALVTGLTRLAYGVFPAMPDDATLVDVWGLTARQASLAALVAEGQTREQAARTLGISLAVAKKELDTVFSALSIRTAAELAQAMAGMGMIAAMLQATGGTVGAAVDEAEPLRFALRRDGTRIAYSDYGPAGGRPVLLVHSSVTTRIASRRLVAALQSAGYRPVSIDRPGFGLTDMVDHADPFVAAAADVAHLSALLRIERWDVVARGGAQAVVAVQRTCPDLVDRVVLVNPDPPTTAESLRHGVLGLFKDLYWRSPRLIRAGARLLASRLTLARLHRFLAHSVAGSAPDEQALTLPGLVEDYYRSVRLFATGRIEGYVAEQHWFAAPPAAAVAPLPGTVNWSLLVGDCDTLHDPAHVARYWRSLLPDATITLLPGKGRLVALAEPDIIVEALKEPGPQYP